MMADSTADQRMTCRFGVRCYQKNPEHHKKFKHPPKRGNQDIKAVDESQAKRPKVFDARAKIDQKINVKHTESRDKIPPAAPSATVSRNIAKFSNNISASESEDDNSNSNDSVLNENVSKQIGKKSESNEKIYKDLKPQEFIKEKFLVDMPEDFYKFWDFCKSINEDEPSAALQDADLMLVGPFDALNGKFANSEKEFTEDEFLVHWRYYYDPPEFQTVLKGNDKTGYHLGYFRDDPEEKPVFMACNSAQKDGLITPMGDNIFAAVCLYLEEQEKTCNPFQKLKVSNLLKAFRKEAENLQYSLMKKTENMKVRERKAVARTFNKVGLVVPFNRKTEVGYRDLYMEEKELSKTLQRIKEIGDPESQESMFDKLQPLFTYTSIAIDECDFGTGVELGWDLLFYGIDALNNTTARFLRTSYELLNREPFATIITAHMANRRKGCKLSIL